MTGVLLALAAVLAAALVATPVTGSSATTRSDAAAGWSGWSPVPGGRLTNDAPDATSGRGNDQNVHVLVVRGAGAAENGIYWNRKSGGPWSGWSELPGGGRTTSAPDAVFYENALYVFVRGTNDRVYVKVFAGGNWSDWAEVPSGQEQFTSAGPRAAVFEGELRLYVRGRDDNRIYFNVYDGQTWTGWDEVPGDGLTADSPEAVTIRGWHLLIVRAAGPNLNRILLAQYDGQGWTDWRELPPGTQRTGSAPRGVVYGERLYVFIRGLNDGLVYLNRWAAGSGWSNWNQVTGNRETESGLGAARYAGDLHLYLRATDNRILLNKLS